MTDAKKTTEAQRRAVIKYKAKTYKRVPFDVRFEEYETIKASAEAVGRSVNGFIKDAIHEKIERMQASDPG